MDHPDLDYQVELTAAPYAAEIVSADFAGGTQLQFDGYGLPSSGGAVVVQSGSYQRTITVDPDSGEPSIGGGE